MGIDAPPRLGLILDSEDERVLWEAEAGFLLTVPAGPAAAAGAVFGPAGACAFTPACVVEPAGAGAGEGAAAGAGAVARADEDEDEDVGAVAAAFAGFLGAAAGAGAALATGFAGEAAGVCAERGGLGAGYWSLGTG